MAEVYIALGSNLGDRAANLRQAVRRIAAHLTVESVSSVYETEPVGLKAQPSFLNAVLRGVTTRAPRDVLDRLVEIEQMMGRERTVPLGPRTIDLDLLHYGGVHVDEAGLSLPHPRMNGRRFVLVPLAEIAPALRPDPGGPTVSELLTAVPPGEGVERIDLADWPPV